MTRVTSTSITRTSITTQKEDTLEMCPGPEKSCDAQAACPERLDSKQLLFLDVDGVLHPLKVRLMGQQQLDTSHCFNPGCMDELRRVILQSGADLVVTSSWRQFETARNVLAKNLGHYGLRVKDWTTTAGGESNEARVDQILSYVTALDLEAWAVVDDEDLAPEALQSSEGMMKMLFRQHFVRTDSSKGLDKSSADSLIQLLNDEENV